MAGTQDFTAAGEGGADAGHSPSGGSDGGADNAGGENTGGADLGGGGGEAPACATTLVNDSFEVAVFPWEEYQSASLSVFDLGYDGTHSMKVDVTVAGGAADLNGIESAPLEDGDCFVFSARLRLPPGAASPGERRRVGPLAGGVCALRPSGAFELAAERRLSSGGGRLLSRRCSRSRNLPVFAWGRGLRPLSPARPQLRG